MKISHKILLFIMFFLAILAANTVVGLVQLSRVENELRSVVNEDIEVLELVTAIMQRQYEKAILVERVIRVAEELSFENVSAGRRQYLLDHLGWITKGFIGLSDFTDKDLRRAEDVLQQRVLTGGHQKIHDRDAVKQELATISEAHRRYNTTIATLFSAAASGSYQISFDDMDRIRLQERTVSKQIRRMLEDVQQYARRSLSQAEYDEILARYILGVSFLVSLIFGAFLTVRILQSILKPLRGLVAAAHQIGAGDLNVHVDESTKNEIGEVSAAFNKMAERLRYANAELEAKRVTLLESLEVTTEQKHDLEQVNRELDSFVYTVSHDIGSPLMGIAWYADYLQKHVAAGLDDKGKKSLDGITSGVARVNQLIKDLLTLTRLARIKNPYEHTDSAALLRTIIERIEFTVREKNVDLCVQPGLPTVVCDRIKIGEVFYNLINNAIKFSAKENTDGRPRVEVGFIDQSAEYEFFVKDNGIGIAPEHHDEIFGLFKRLHTVKEYEGSGAGLCIVKGVVLDHGGRIWIESTLGKGAAFHFTIPKNLVVKSIQPSEIHPPGSVV